MTKTIETIKTPLLSEHGTYMFGKLDELDFTLAWKKIKLKKGLLWKS